MKKINKACPSQYVTGTKQSDLNSAQGFPKQFVLAER